MSFSNQAETIKALKASLVKERLERARSEKKLKKEVEELREQVKQLSSQSGQENAEIEELKKSNEKYKKELKEVKDVFKQYRESAIMMGRMACHWTNQNLKKTEKIVQALESKILNGGELKTLEKSNKMICGICVRPYVEDGITIPKVLGCGHTVCHGCCTLLADMEGRSISCPYCRTPTSLGVSMVFGLPKNFALFDQSD